MNLHLDKDAFITLLENINVRTGYRTDVLEKDYYVVLILKELATLQEEGLPAHFKGGTALYKALKTTNRFSEDIDLSVDTRNCTRTQNDKRLEKATKKFVSLPRNPDMGHTNRSEVVSIYQYSPVTRFDESDALQRFGKLKIEATSFTISEPVEKLSVSSLIYDFATNEEKRVLEEVYDVKPFEVETITLERIFIDKLFAAEAYVRRSDEKNRAFEAAKHIYDLSVMSTNPKINNFLENAEQMEKLLLLRLIEELNRLDGIPGVLPVDFVFLKTTINNKNVQEAYETMQKQYVLREQDKITFDNANKSLVKIENNLFKNPAWSKFNMQDIKNLREKIGSDVKTSTGEAHLSDLINQANEVSINTKKIESPRKEQITKE